MTDGVVQVPPDSSGKKIATATYTDGGSNTVYAEKVVPIDSAGHELSVTSHSGTYALDVGEPDGWNVALGATTDAEASGNGGVVALLKRLRTLLSGGLPAALGGNGGLKIEGVASGTAVPVSGSFWQSTQPVSLASGAAAIAKAEDVASADADVGVPAMAVRKATPANTSGTDGDYEMLQISAGRLWASATVDAALPAGTNAIGKLAANDGVDVGDVTINNASGGAAVNIQDGGNSITIDGTVAVSSLGGTVTADTELTTADLDTGAGTDTRAVVGLVYGHSGGATIVSDTNPMPVGDNAGSLTVDSPQLPSALVSGRLDVSLGAALPAGTNAIGKLAANDGVDIGDVTINNASGGSAVNIQDGGNSITIDGTVAATQSGTWNVGTVTTVTNVVHVDDNSSTLSIDDGSGSITVDGSVTANAGTNLNTSALALESGGNLATVAGAVRAEDAASADGHTGVPAMAVRKAAPANTSGTDGDYEMLQVSAGRLWASATVDAALPAGTNNIGKVSGLADVVSATTAAWGTGTSVDTAISVAVTGYATAVLSLSPTGTFTAGTLIFEVSDDAGTTWFPTGGVRSDSPTMEATFNMTAVGTKKLLWQFNVAGLTNIRVRLNPVIAGSSTPTANLRLQASGAPTGTHTIAPQAVTATLSNVSSSASSVTLLAANQARLGAMIFNDSNQLLYAKFGSTASATSHTVQLQGGAYYELPTCGYTGIITGIWAAANGSARVTELT